MGVIAIGGEDQRWPVLIRLLPMDLKVHLFLEFGRCLGITERLNVKVQSRILNLILSQGHEDLHADRIVQNVAENRKTILTLAFYKL